MSKTGKLIGAIRSDDRKCARCGHHLVDHKERPYGDPGYRAFVFYCYAEDCTCKVDTTTESEVAK